MAGLELFRKLGVGAKFNYKRFQHDAEKIHIIKSKSEAQQTELDFFGSDKLNANKRKENESLQCPVQKKRKFSNEAVKNSDSSDDDDQSSDEDSDGSAERNSSENEDVSSEESGGSSSEEESGLRLLTNMKTKDSSKEKLGKPDSKQRKPAKKKSVKKIAQLKQEQVNHFRKVKHIHLHGTDVPDPVKTFEEMREEYGIHPQIIKNLISMGFNEPTPIQMQAIPAMLHRREVLSCAPTGSGKTAAFIIPILHHLKAPQKKGFRALVLAPTRELAKQTYREFSRVSEGLGFRIHFIEKATTAAKKFGPKSSGHFDILVTTPNRLVYMLNEELISLTRVEWLVVDESDKLFEEGKTGFRDQLATIYKSCDSHNVRRAMFSATFAYDVEEWCKLNLDNVVQVYIGARNSATETIDQELVFVGSESGKLLAVRDVIRKGFQPPVLIFVQSKERAKELFHELIYDGINVDVIHADRTQQQRDNVVKCFREGKIWVLICTELMGRGIDFKGVNLVINYDFPSSAISYIHRIGRTGRAGRQGRAVTYFTEEDAVNLRSIANVLREAGCVVPDYMLEMKKPSKKARRKLAKRAPKRDTIRTLPKADLEKSKWKRETIQAKLHGTPLPRRKVRKRDYGKGPKVHGKTSKKETNSTNKLQTNFTGKKKNSLPKSQSENVPNSQNSKKKKKVDH